MVPCSPLSFNLLLHHLHADHPILPLASNISRDLDSVVVGNLLHAKSLLLALISLLPGVALVLLVTATHALGEVALVAEAGPRLEVLAALAPLDLKAGGGMDPNGDVTRRADALVLVGDDDALALGSGGVDGTILLGDVVPLSTDAALLVAGLEAVPTAHDAASLGAVGSGAGGGLLVALLALALSSRLDDEGGVVDDVLVLRDLSVHHGGHVLSLVALGGGLAGRVVGVACLGGHGIAHLGGGAGELLLWSLTFGRLDRGRHRRLEVKKMVGMMRMVVLEWWHHYGHACCIGGVKMGLMRGRVQRTRHRHERGGSRGHVHGLGVGGRAGIELEVMIPSGGRREGRSGSRMVVGWMALRRRGELQAEPMKPSATAVGGIGSGTSGGGCGYSGGGGSSGCSTGRGGSLNHALARSNAHDTAADGR